MDVSVEERLAHLERQVEDLSEVVARQDAELATLARRVGLLIEQAAAQQVEGTGGVIVGDERPPHY